MTEEQTIEGNKLIREFMGHGGMAVRFHYDREWNHLMPVVEKIESLGYDSQISRLRLDVQIGIECCFCKEGKNTSEDGWDIIQRSNTKVEAVWLSVVEFIKNQNK